MKLEISTWHDICISQAGSQRAGHGAGGETRAGEWQESPNGWRGAGYRETGLRGGARVFQTAPEVQTLTERGPSDGKNND